MLKGILKIIVGFFIGSLLSLGIVAGYFVFQDYTMLQEAKKVHEQDECYQYYYSKLTEEEKEDYQKVYYCFKNHKESVIINKDNLTDTEKIYYSVIDDHPEFYYVKSEFEYIEEDEFTVFPEYTYSADEVKQIDSDIEKNIENIISHLDQDMLQRIRTIYDYIIEITEYKRNDDDQNMKSVFIDNESVCAGYARAYQYLLNKADIDASYIGGHSIDNDEGHAWVMIHFDNDYYYSDPTWGDVITKGMEHSCSAFFMMSSDEMLCQYIPDGIYEKTMNHSYQYFKNINCYMETYDRDIVKNAVKLGLSNKTRIAEIKCSNKKVFNKLKREIEDNYLGYHILKECGCYSSKAQYLCDEKTLMVEIYY